MQVERATAAQVVPCASAVDCTADEQRVDTNSQVPLAGVDAMCGSTCVCAAGHATVQVVECSSAVAGTTDEQGVDVNSQLPLADRGRTVWLHVRLRCRPWCSTGRA